MNGLFRIKLSRCCDPHSMFYVEEFPPRKKTVFLFFLLLLYEFKRSWDFRNSSILRSFHSVENLCMETPWEKYVENAKKFNWHTCKCGERVCCMCGPSRLESTWPPWLPHFLYYRMMWKTTWSSHCNG